MLCSISRTQNSFNPTILDSECNCPTRFICYNIPAWLLQFHPCRLPLKQISHLRESKTTLQNLFLESPNTIMWHHSCKNCTGFWLNSDHSTRPFCLLLFWRLSTRLSFSDSMCIWTNTKPLLIVWEAPESPKAQHQNVRTAFFQLSCPFCLELSAIRSQKFFYPSNV